MRRTPKGRGTRLSSQKRRPFHPEKKKDARHSQTKGERTTVCGREPAPNVAKGKTTPFLESIPSLQSTKKRSLGMGKKGKPPLEKSFPSHPKEMRRGKGAFERTSPASEKKGSLGGKGGKGYLRRQGKGAGRLILMENPTGRNILDYQGEKGIFPSQGGGACALLGGKASKTGRKRTS